MLPIILQYTGPHFVAAERIVLSSVAALLLKIYMSHMQMDSHAYDCLSLCLCCTLTSIGCAQMEVII